MRVEPDPEYESCKSRLTRVDHLGVRLEMSEAEGTRSVHGTRARPEL